ncbi:MAG: sugar-binding protein [Acidobacteriota bacterium]
MKKVYLLLSFVLLSFAAKAQVFTIEGFDRTKPDTAFTVSSEGNKSSIVLTQNTADKKEGAASMEFKTTIGAYHQWGSYAQIGYKGTVGVTQDWSLSDTIRIWLKVTKKPTHPENLVFRIHIQDRPTAADPVEEYIFETPTILDYEHDWIQLKVPFIERPQSTGGDTVPDSTGFILAPTTWGGFTYNNKKLDRDKISSWLIGIVTTGWDPAVNLPADSVVVLMDGFQRTGARAVPVIFFNGKDYQNVSAGPWPWGQSTVSTEVGAGTNAKANALKWVLGDEWGNGWSGVSYDLTSQNMLGSWPKDSLQFKLKTTSTIDTLRMQFESANGKRAVKFHPIADGAWHTYKFKLASMLFDDGAPKFDTSAVTKFGFMTNGNNGTYKVKDVIWLTDIWTGNPTFDVIPPDAPTNVKANPGSYVNVITWTDTPNETGATYDVYFSDKTFTDVDAATVEDVQPTKLAAGTQMATHVLRAPITDQNVTYFYGVTAKDAAGNVGTPAVIGPITTKAKGYPTVSMTPPANWKADGSMAKWSGITPFILSTVSAGNGHVNENGKIDGDADCSGKLYLAMDSQNLYVAFDMTDDVVAFDSTQNTYTNDAPDLFLGLYDWRGKHHAGYTRGAKPDYHFRFCQNKLMTDNGGKNLMFAGHPNYYWKKKALAPGYVTEAKIPFAMLAEAFTDSLFKPVEGMRLPFDVEINDRDNQATANDGMLCYSTNNSDNSWSDMFHWTHTWIGAKWTTGVAQTSQVAKSFELSQNYPNPFNPSTKINYSIAKASQVSLKVFDVLGREVASLVNGYQPAGTYTVSFDAGKLAAGMYVYRIDAGSFSVVKKMLLVK